MSGSFPGARVHKYGAVKSRIVRRFLNEFFPPCFFDVIFEFYALSNFLAVRVVFGGQCAL